MTAGRGFFGVAIACACAAVPAAASAATIQVETTADAVTVNGDCSLREALNAANGDTNAGGDCGTGSGADTIQIPAGTYTLAGSPGEDLNAGGDLDVRNAAVTATATSGDVTLRGAGNGSNPAVDTIIDGGDADRILDIQNDATFSADATVEDLTIQNGNATGVSNDRGGGIRLRDNFDGTLTVTRSSLAGNDADDTGGGIALVDGTSTTTHQLVITDSELVGNTAVDDGGAMLIGSGTTPVSSGANSAEITNTTFTQNHSSAEGGAIYLENAPRVDLLNTTLTANTADTGGGAVAMGSASAELHGQFSTIAGNSTPLAIGGGGIQTDIDNQAAFFEGTILAGNTANGAPKNCTEIDGMFSDGVFNGISLGYSLDSGNTCDLGDDVGVVEDPTGDLINTDPLLGALAANGGETRTMALGTGSPAIDRVPNGPPDYCRHVETTGVSPVAVDLATDQRGLARPTTSSGLCDIGAIEVQPAIACATSTAGCGPAPPGKRCKKKKKKKGRSAAAAKKKKCKKKRKKK